MTRDEEILNCLRVAQSALTCSRPVYVIAASQLARYAMLRIEGVSEPFTFIHFGEESGDSVFNRLMLDLGEQADIIEENGSQNG